MKLKKNKWQGALVFLMLGLLGLMTLHDGKNVEEQKITYQQFWEMAKHGEICKVEMGTGENWRVFLSDNSQAITPNPRADDSKERLLAYGIDVKEEKNTASYEMLLMAAALLAGMALLRGNGKNAMGLQKYASIQADERIPQITFDDIAVGKETMQSMNDLVAFLKTPEQFRKYGARIPKGVMLYGPPGTGKTLLARALAGEAHAPFFALSGSDFVQVYVGVGASRVRELFKKARKAGGGVIFIDEIDAIGKKRDSGNDEREQTLNALLTEMSGFSESDGIIVLAATNRLDTLDQALLREGRFDRRIEIGLPDLDERMKILQVHARKKPVSDRVNLADWAARTTLFSGAQLETMLNEAAIRAVRRNAPEIETEDLEKAFCMITVGEENPRGMTEKEKKITAYHEAGHAIITKKMLPEARLMRLTIIPSSRGAAGYLMSIQKDKIFHSRKELFGMLCAAFGGRVAEEMIFGEDEITTGASGDLKKAKEIASAMADEWCMGESKDTLEKEAQEETRICLRENREYLEALAQALLDRETLTENEINQLIA